MVNLRPVPKGVYRSCCYPEITQSQPNVYLTYVTHCKLLIYIQLRLLSPDQLWTTLSPNHLTELSILLTCFGKINSPLKNRFSDSPRTSTIFKRCNFPRCSQCHHLRCLYLFHDGCRYHIETSPLINSANQWTGFYMITAPSWKS